MADTIEINDKKYIEVINENVEANCRYAYNNYRQALGDKDAPFWQDLVNDPKQATVIKAWRAGIRALSIDITSNIANLGHDYGKKFY